MTAVAILLDLASWDRASGHGASWDAVAEENARAARSVLTGAGWRVLDLPMRHAARRRVAAGRKQEERGLSRPHRRDGR